MTALNKYKSEKGFTLIELLVVIGILAILLAITLIAINPARQFGQANDTKRRSDINAILNAIGQYAASNSGNLPGSVQWWRGSSHWPGGHAKLCRRVTRGLRGKMYR